MRIILEGPLSLPHSYSLVGRFLALELARRSDLEVYHRDLPPASPAWRTATVPNPGAGDQWAVTLPPPPSQLRPDATVRLTYPFDLRPASSGRTLVFGTAEFAVLGQGTISAGYLAGVNRTPDLAVMVPSTWAQLGFIRGGVDPRRVVVVPHGIDPDLFRPLPDAQRQDLRRRLGWDDAFVFLNLGAMTTNKGIIELLRAFTAVRRQTERARLVLKGLDVLYQSNRIVETYLANLPADEAALARGGLTYVGATLGFAEIAELYQAADAYVSPYHAEGFNLPVLEAAACGLPVLCTRGGPTDDFTRDDFALPIRSHLRPTVVDGIRDGLELAPEEAHLAERMTRLVDDRAWRQRAKEAGPAFVRQDFTWAAVVDRLLGLLGDPASPCWQVESDPARASALVLPLPRNARPVPEKTQARAIELYQAGQRQQAEQLCLENLRADPLAGEAVYLLGVMALEGNQPERALLAFQQAATLAPGNAVHRNALAEAYRARGDLEAARECFLQALCLDPKLAQAHHGLGLVLVDMGEPGPAADSFRAALALRPNNERTHLNLGRALQQLGDLEEAAASYAEAIRLKRDYSLALNNLGAVRMAQGAHAEAAANFREALRLQPQYPEAHLNLGNLQLSLGEVALARDSFREAIRARPAYPRAHHGLGRALEALNEWPAALQCYREAVRLQPDNTEALYALGNLLLIQPDWEAGLATFTRLVELEPDNAEARSRLLFARQQLCDWSNLEADATWLWHDAETKIAAGKRPGVLALATLNLPWSPERQLAVARSHSDAVAVHVATLQPSLGLPPQRRSAADRKPGRLRIGYVCCEFRDHAVSHQLQGVFGLHDRQAFEIFAYSFGPDDRSSYRQRIARDSEHFVDLSNASLGESGRRIRADDIDIIIDLQGWSGFERMSLLALRQAPIQAHYLGYPGSSGASYLDYLIGDPIVTPLEHAGDYREQLVLLPHTYLATDNEQPVASAPLRRSKFGLSEEVVVFCGFGNRYKLEPRMFDTWMRILGRVAGSILWLSGAGAPAERNLRREAEKRGIRGQRLVFGGHVSSKADHLARHRLADLFLDTLYYNAHSSAADALWAGLPILTCPGQTFASRVGASLLTAAGLPELIARDLKHYEQLAVDLAGDAERRKVLRARLQEQRLKAPLFDTKRFVRNMERAYRAMWEVYEIGESPRHLVVREDD